MTFKEQWVKDNPGKEFSPRATCPSICGYDPEGHCANPEFDADVDHVCGACWNREMPPRDHMTPRILDSGERRQFKTGAVRDIQEGKGRCDLMPLRVLARIWRTFDTAVEHIGVDKAKVFDHIADFQDTGDTQHLELAIHHFVGYLDYPTAFLEVAKHFEEGAKKYGENNWQKGLPVHCYIDSAVRHYLKWLRGDKDEPHDRAFVWNLLCCIWECDFSPRAKEKENATTITLYADNTPIEHIPSDLVRYGDCPAGLFELGDEGVFVKTEIADADKYGAYIAIHVNTGHTRLLDNDILVRPIDSPFTDERCGDE